MREWLLVSVLVVMTIICEIMDVVSKKIVDCFSRK